MAVEMTDCNCRWVLLSLLLADTLSRTLSRENAITMLGRSFERMRFSHGKGEQIYGNYYHELVRS